MSVRRSSITDLSDYIKLILRPGTPRKGRGWPTIAQLPGDIKDPDQPKFKPNLVAYQVCCSLQKSAYVRGGSYMQGLCSCVYMCN